MGTANNLFLRSLGSSLGVAVFGALANAAIGSHVDPAGLTTAVHRVFLTTVVVAVLMLVAATMLPGGRVDRSA